MPVSRWINDVTGEQLDHDQLSQLRDRAHRLYEANTHIFEDENEAVRALGVVLGHERHPYPAD
jgi:hypothetical protein